MVEHPQTNSPPASADSLFSTLANARRRQILRLLTDRGLTTITELAEAIVAEGADTELSDSSEADLAVRQIRLQLHHNHVPKLAEANLIVYDREKETVALAPPSERFELVRSLVAATE